MTHLSKKQLLELKEMLKEEKHRLAGHFSLRSEHESEFEDSLQNSTGELSAYDNHPADLGTETFERERDMAVDDMLEAKQEEVERALALMDSGEYGKCSICGEDIPFERLQAVPFAGRCVEHAAAVTAETGTADKRPVEEQVMTPPPAGAGGKRQANAGRFDDAGAWQTLENYGNASNTVKPDA